ncbi:hypothetical protein B296_00016279, partial [Ensete ventricosum]
SFYSKCYGSFVPEVLTVLIAYHVIVLHHTLRGPCSEWGQIGPKSQLDRAGVREMSRPEGKFRHNLVDLAERANSGINLGDLAERANSDINPSDLVERMNLGINLDDSTERANSGTNLGDLAERVNLGSNFGDLAERVNSGTNLGDSAKRASSSTNPRGLAERVNSGTNLGDLAERANSSTNLGDSVERANSGTNLRGLGDPETSPSGESSRPPSPVDARVLRDLEVMKVGHDLDMAVTEGSLAAIRERYNILTEYGLHVPRSGQRPYSLDTPGGTPPPAVGAGAVHTPLGSFAGLSRQGDGVGKFSTLISTLLVSFQLSPYDRCFVQNQHFQMVLFDRVHDAGRLITFMDYHISNLQQEIDTLKSGGGPEVVAAVEERASELEKELEKTKREWDEALQRLKASDKELNEARGNLSEIQRLLKKARVRAWKMDDELL